MKPLSNARVALLAAIVTITASVFAVGAAATSASDSRAAAPTSGPTGSTAESPAGSTAGSPASTVVDISISQFAFDPPEVSVVVGTGVTWTNDDEVTHNIFTSDGQLASADLERGDVYSITFQDAAVIEYFCDIHQYMRGTVTVTP